jgi:outer membrane protein
MRTFGSLLRPAGALLVLAAASHGAWAQTPAAPAAAAPAPANVPTYGPPLAGLCVFSRDAALSTSQAGVSVNQQLQTMQQGVAGPLNAERDSIAAADKALTAEKPKLSAAKFQEQADALQRRAQTYSATVQTRNAQFTQTRDNALNQIAQSVTPILVSTITEHKCSLIVERNGIYGANPAMDLTPEVIQRLNAVLPTVTVPPLPAATAP